MFLHLQERTVFYMNENDMSNIVNQLNKMMQNNEIPDGLKDIVNNFKNSSSNTNSSGNDSRRKQFFSRY